MWIKRVCLLWRRLAAFIPTLILIGFLSSFLSGCLLTTNIHQQDLMHIDCLTPPDPGPCKGALPGFYYDYQSDRCKAFHYGGCDGHRPFESLEACLKACGGAP